MATSPRAGRPVSAETRATASATPADAPSLDRAASAGCTCTSVESSGPAAQTRHSAFARTHVSAMSTDSRSSGPAVPVTRNWPRPGRHAASTTSTSPPVAVAASRTLSVPEMVERLDAAGFAVEAVLGGYREESLVA